MAKETTLQVIELQQLPIIVERLHSVKADIEQRTAEALSLVCTEQTYKSVKDARAQLTKEFKEYEAQRIAVKDKILEPYAEFEKVGQTVDLKFAAAKGYVTFVFDSTVVSVTNNDRNIRRFLFISSLILCL